MATIVYYTNKIWNVLMLAHCDNIATMSTMATMATMLFPDTLFINLGNTKAWLYGTYERMQTYY